jgi:hypothetical protein
MLAPFMGKLTFVATFNIALMALFISYHSWVFFMLVDSWISTKHPTITIVFIVFLGIQL